MLDGDDPRIRVVGDRCLRQDGKLTFDVPAIVEVRMACPGQPVNRHGVIELTIDGGSSHFDLLVNGRFIGCIMCSHLWVCQSWRYIFEIPAEVMSSSATLAMQLIKRTEANTMQVLPMRRTRPVTLYSISLPLGYEALEPVIGPRRIEFVGDSSCTAYGSDGPPTTYSVSGILGISLAYQNIRHSWCHSLSRMLDAEPSVVAWSGVGVASNAWGSLCDQVLGTYHSRAVLTHKTGAGSVFDFWSATWMPQIVCVMVGANDLYNSSPVLTGDRLVAAYIDLLCQIRRQRPAPVLILAVVHVLAYLRGGRCTT